MKVHNFLPLLLECLKDWQSLPPKPVFEERYCRPMEKWLKPLFEDLHSRFGCGFYSLLEGLDWPAYRQEALTLDPHKEQVRVYKYLAQVEKLLGVKLAGEVLLFGGFSMIDGYARFEGGEHCVYLGVDESHGRGAYLDILMAHELTHVAREGQASVWQGYGLSPKMSHDEFVENQPVLEHLFSEGFSCAISELLVPSTEPWHYVYQTEDSLAHVLAHGPALDRVIHPMIKKPNADYSDLYQTELYQPEQPRYAHYVWAWRWVKNILEKKAGGDPKKILSVCSKEFMSDALKFHLCSRKSTQKESSQKKNKKPKTTRKPAARSKRRSKAKGSQ